MPYLRLLFPVVPEPHSTAHNPTHLSTLDRLDLALNRLADRAQLSSCHAHSREQAETVAVELERCALDRAALGLARGLYSMLARVFSDGCVALRIGVMSMLQHAAQQCHLQRHQTVSSPPAVRRRRPSHATAFPSCRMNGDVDLRRALARATTDATTQPAFPVIPSVSSLSSCASHPSSTHIHHIATLRLIVPLGLVQNSR